MFSSPWRRVCTSRAGDVYSPTIMRWKTLSVVCLAVCCAAAAQRPSSENLRATHEALFASFIPIAEVPEKPDVQRMFGVTRDAIWRDASPSPQFQRLLAPFADLRLFGAYQMFVLSEITPALPDEDVAVGHERHDGWVQAVALRIGDDLDAVATHRRDDRVRRPEIDSDDGFHEATLSAERAGADV